MHKPPRTTFQLLEIVLIQYHRLKARVCLLPVAGVLFGTCLFEPGSLH